MRDAADLTGGWWMPGDVFVNGLCIWVVRLKSGDDLRLVSYRRTTWQEASCKWLYASKLR